MFLVGLRGCVSSHARDTPSVAALRGLIPRVTALALTRNRPARGHADCWRLAGDAHRGMRQSPRLPCSWSPPRLRHLSHKGGPLGRSLAWPHLPRHGACADAQPPRPGWGSGPSSPPPIPRNRYDNGVVRADLLIRPARWGGARRPGSMALRGRVASLARPSVHGMACRRRCQVGHRGPGVVRMARDVRRWPSARRARMKPCRPGGSGDPPLQPRGCVPGITECVFSA